MKIIDNALKGITFGNLGMGATFHYGEAYFIKTKTITSGELKFNAVNLEEGMVAYFDDAENVIPFECELIIL